MNPSRDGIMAYADYKCDTSIDIDSSSACALDSGPSAKGEEELLLVKYEMDWTTRSFLHKAQEWQDRYEEPNPSRSRSEGICCAAVIAVEAYSM